MGGKFFSFVNHYVTMTVIHFCRHFGSIILQFVLLVSTKHYLTYTLMPVYHCHKPVFRPKMAIFRRAGMREGGLPLPLTFQYLIFMIWRPSDLNLVMISSLASKCQHFKLRGLQFHSIKWLKNGHPNFKVLAFWSQLRYHDQIQIIRSSYQKNQILKS